MLRLSFKCPCGWAGTNTIEAQGHSNVTGHTVRVLGCIEAERPQVMHDPTVQITDHARRKIMEAEILRRARAMGVVR